MGEYAFYDECYYFFLLHFYVGMADLLFFVPEKDIYRISFTLPLINRAKQVLLLISGKEKTHVLKKIFSKRISKYPLPVQMLKGNVLWMINRGNS